jgi:hypothetical protein
MNRKEFLQTMAQAGAVAGTALTGLWASIGNAQAAQSVGPSTPHSSAPAFRGKRTKTEFTCTVSGKPSLVFPLLCPVREYDWLDDWRGELIYSESGVAEDNCIFRTDFHGAPMIWSAIRYEPFRHIEYLAIAARHLVMRLRIDLAPVEGGKTRMQWKRTFTGLSEAGNEHVASMTPESEKKLCEKLEFYLKTGKKWVADHS